ncbi:sperm-associated antigen 8 [Rhinoraja longicauda]
MEQVVCDERLTNRLAPLWNGVRRGEGETAGGSRTGSGGAGERGKCEVEETGKQPQPQPEPEPLPEQEVCVCKEDGDEQVPTEARADTAPESNKDRIIKNKCLLGNWLEERMSAPIDQRDAKVTNAVAFKNGHKGLLSIDHWAKMSDISTYREYYTPPRGPEERERGIKKELIEKYLRHKICKKVYDEHEALYEIKPMESLSVTGQDFKMEGFKSVPPPPVMRHDYKTDQPITIWSDNVKQVPSFTEMKTGDTPFRKNTSFTKPIMEALDT